jgi:hypothetical protein
MAVRRPQRALLEGAGAEQTEGYEIEPGDVEFEATPVELARKLRRIHDNARTSVEERGVTTLHLTFGALSWRDDWLGDSISPIWMVPVQLISKGPNAPLRLKLADEEIQPNPALELYLRERHKIILPEMPEDPSVDALNGYLAAVQRAATDQRWSVTPEVWLSTFSFESLVIYQDLKALAEVALTHPVVAALARTTVIGDGSDEIGDALDNLKSPDTVPIPFLPADSSQVEALTYGAAGAHLVIHGPPGTGKSQTITNLIADSLGRNKKILFVSSKMAALNVVHQRLAEKGLERFCLEAHSTKAGKTKIIDELRRTLESDDLSDGGRFEENLGSLLRVRADLNRYVQELHRVREPFGKTLYQAIGLTQNAQATSGQQARSFVYDWMGRMTSETNPESGMTTYTYDKHPGDACGAGADPGNLTQIAKADGTYSCYLYDGLHRVTDVGYSGPNGNCKRFRFDNTSGVQGSIPPGVTVANTLGRLAEAETDTCGVPVSTITDEWFSYSPRGELTDVYEKTPHSGGYYHTTAAYWQNGALETLSGVPGVPTLNYGGGGTGLDGEGRYTKVTASSGTNPVTAVTYSTTSTADPLGSLLKVTFGSADFDSFTYNPKSGRMATYTFSVNSVTDKGTLTWNTNGTLKTLAIGWYLGHVGHSDL